MRGRGSSIAANPVLIGAATTLVVVVAVFLSYNANAGLPFVPTYSCKRRGSERREPGQGQRRARRRYSRRRRRLDHASRQDDGDGPGGRAQARGAVDPLATDSTVIVRPRSALGLKYVQLTRGTSEEGTTTATRSRSRRPRRSRSSSTSSSTCSTRRRARRRRRTCAASATPSRVAARASTSRSASCPRCWATSCRWCGTVGPGHAAQRLLRGPGDAASSVAPVAKTQAALFAALTRPSPRSTRSRSRTSRTRSPRVAPSLDVAIRSFPVQRPFLRNSEGLFRTLQPGIDALRNAAPELAEMFEEGHARSSARRRSTGASPRCFRSCSTSRPTRW